MTIVSQNIQKSLSPDSHFTKKNQNRPQKEVKAWFKISENFLLGIKVCILFNFWKIRTFEIKFVV